MVNSLAELKSALDTLQIPVAYNHFNTKTSTPYICYLVSNQDNFYADDKVYLKNKVIDIELYTDIKDETLEEQLETVLNNNNIPFEMTQETYISGERLYEVVYQITL